MRTATLCLLASSAACARLAGAADPGPPPSIVRIALPPEPDERQPFLVPTEPENTVEIDLPWPLEDWAGRGFTPDAEKFAGDFVIEATRGTPRMFVTPVAAGAHRVLHVVLAQPGGATRGVPVEFVPAPTGLAWRKVVFLCPAPAGAPRPTVTLSDWPPRTRLRKPSPESQIGLLRTMRLMLNTTAEGAGDIARANSALALTSLGGTPRSFGDFTIANRFAVTDATTGTLGICASVANQTARRLLLDPSGWVVRAGDRVYPAGTVDFAGELEPGATEGGLLLVARGPDGGPARLRSDNDFEVSALLAGSANPRPVARMTLAGLSPQ